MITRNELTAQISGTIGKTKVLELSEILREQNFALRDLIDLTFHADKDIAFRSAWILENVFLEDPVRYETDLEYLISKVKEVTYASCQRHYVKIIMHLTDDNIVRTITNKLKSVNMEPVVEQCFDWLIDPKVKVFAARALFNLKDCYPWINDELANQIKFLMRDGSPGIQSRGKKLLAKL